MTNYNCTLTDDNVGSRTYSFLTIDDAVEFASIILDDFFDASSSGEDELKLEAFASGIEKHVSIVSNNRMLSLTEVQQ